MRLREISKRQLYIGILIISVIGMMIRWLGMEFEGIDYRMCLSSWYEQLKEAGSLRGLAEFEGDYNMPYATILYLLTFLPIRRIVAIKMVSILFDYVVSFAVMMLARKMFLGEKRTNGDLMVYALVLLNPLVIINSAFLAQSESIWAAFALWSIYFIMEDHPAIGMIALGCALATKLQAIFILPIILVYYFYKKRFTILHLLWVPLTIEVLCIPAIIGGCSWDIAFRVFARMLGLYPFVYYFYPNVWTFFQNAPYYVFGEIAIIMAFVVLLIFAVLFVKGKRSYKTLDYLTFIAWTSMTCAMFLPCMHERYNYIAEITLPICAIGKPKYRLPALLLVLTSMQCNGQSYLGWNKIAVYILALCNIVIYIYLSIDILRGLYKDYKAGEVKAC